MGYTQAQTARIRALIDEIESRKPHTNAAPTYRDVPLLRALADYVPEHPGDEDLETAILIVRFLAENYEALWRIAECNKWYRLLLELYGRCTPDGAPLEQDYYLALRARNYHRKDTCEDLHKLAQEFLPPETIAEEESAALNAIDLRHDPVELTQEYCMVIDEVDRRVEEAGSQTLFPFEKWKLKRELLKEYGIDWRPPAAMEPGIRLS